MVTQTAAAKEQVTLDVSRNGLIRTLGDQFTNKTTFIFELMQNARRAGASRVDIDYASEEGLLIIRDDGAGISTPQALLTIGKSGWDNLELMEEENPFGIGFASAIFAATTMSVMTGNWSVDINTEELLSFKPVDIKPGSNKPGTEIKLTLKSSLIEYFSEIGTYLNRTVETKSKGFPIPVFVNGVEVLRTEALDDSFKPFAYGHYQYDFNPKTATIEADIYLQGFKISHPSRRLMYSKAPIIVHLDPAAFRARVPDRDVLIDEQEAAAKIYKALTDEWIKELKARREGMEAVDFVETYSEAIVSLGICSTGLLDELPLASSLWGEYGDVPRYEKYESEGHAEISHNPGITLPMSSRLIKEIEYGGAEHAAASVYAYKLAWPVLTKPLNQSHWAEKNSVDIQNLVFTVTPKGVTKEASFSGHYVWGLKIQLCDSYILTPSGEDGLPDIEVTDCATVCAERHIVFIPKNAVNYYSIETLLLQFSSYCSDSEHDDNSLDEDTEDLLGVVKAALGESGDGILTSLLERTSRGVRTSLSGQTFSVSFDANGNPTVSVDQA